VCCHSPPQLVLHLLFTNIYPLHILHYIAILSTPRPPSSSFLVCQIPSLFCRRSFLSFSSHAQTILVSLLSHLLNSSDLCFPQIYIFLTLSFNVKPSVHLTILSSVSSIFLPIPSVTTTVSIRCNIASPTTLL